MHALVFDRIIASIAVSRMPSEPKKTVFCSVRERRFGRKPYLVGNTFGPRRFSISPPVISLGVIQYDEKNGCRVFEKVDVEKYYVTYNISTIFRQF